MEVKEIENCRICGNHKLIEVINLGEHALSGRFPAKSEPDPPKGPLVLVKCDDISDSRNCGLLQLKHNFSLNELYEHHYGYRSGLNKTMTFHLQNLVKEIESKINLSAEDVILDIGSNDATLLNSFSQENLKKIGIDPTGKQFQQYYPASINLISDYFNLDNYIKISPDKKAKIITSIAMFYDLPDPIKFVEDIKEILHPDGLWVLEQSYMPTMLQKNSFDTICHEHLEYYSLKQIEWIAKKTGLRILDVNFNEINGGSFRVTVCHDKSSYTTNSEKIGEVFKEEEEMKLNTLGPYQEFKTRVEEIKKLICEFINQVNREGKSIYVYGASTKGNTLLQYFGIDNSLITAAVERNPEKYGRRTPLTNIPIISEEEARRDSPDYLLVLPWHFKSEFIEREKDYLAYGGKFIFPLPEFEVV